MCLRIVSWCNGSTTGFGSVCQGSNPCETTYRRLSSKAWSPILLCLVQAIRCIGFGCLFIVGFRDLSIFEGNYKLTISPDE